MLPRGNIRGKFIWLNPQGGDIAGKEVFKSVTDIPNKIDLAVVTVPAEKGFVSNT